MAYTGATSPSCLTGGYDVVLPKANVRALILMTVTVALVCGTEVNIETDEEVGRALADLKWRCRWLVRRRASPAAAAAPPPLPPPPPSAAAAPRRRRRAPSAAAFPRAAAAAIRRRCRAPARRRRHPPPLLPPWVGYG